jgi:hypothetical protein
MTPEETAAKRECEAALEKARAEQARVNQPAAVLSGITGTVLRLAEVVAKNVAFDEARLTMARVYLLEAAEILKAVADEKEATPSALKEVKP